MSFSYNPCSGHLCLLEGKQDLVFLYEGMMLKFPVSYALKASYEQCYGFNKMMLYIKVKHLSESWPLGAVFLELHICTHLEFLMLNVLLLLGNEIFAIESFYVMKNSVPFFTTT